MSLMIRSFTMACACILAIFLGSCSSPSLQQRAAADMLHTGTINAPSDTASANAALPSISEQDIARIMTTSDWQYEGPVSKGIVRYQSNGTFQYQEGGAKGSGTWRARDGALCESFAPSSVMPRGWPETCRPIVKAGLNYQVAKTIFTPML